MKCIFCFNKLIEDETILINDLLDEKHKTTAGDLIKFYFASFSDKLLRYSVRNGICQNCWVNVDSFHEFYSLVSNNYDVDIPLDLESLDDSISKTDDLIVYDGGDENDIFPDEPIKQESNDENAVWVSEARENELAEDQRTRETANMNCDICSVFFDSLRDAKLHFRQVHKMDGYIICCNRKFKQRCRLVDHVNTHYSFSYSCHICNKAFDSKSYLNKHMACHETVKKYTCDKCHKTFAKKFQIRSHINSVHVYENSEPTIECPMENCFKKFVNQIRLKHHIDYTHAVVNMETCKICSKTFKTKGTLEEHKKTHMKRRPEDRIKCEICGHFLADMKSFTKHMQNHATEGLENICNYCNKKYPNLNALRKHIKYVHETLKTFTCKYCGKSFKRSRNLIDHEASVHTMKDLYTCTFCPRTFRTQSNMLSHRKNQHPDQYQKPAYMRDDSEFSGKFYEDENISGTN